MASLSKTLGKTLDPTLPLTLSSGLGSGGGGGDTPAARLMFSEFRTTGNTSAAFRDTDKFDAALIGTGQESAVVTAASLGILDWPTPNIFQGRIHANAIWPSVQVQYNWGTPTIGEVRYNRMYLRVTFANTLTPDAVEGNLMHGVESADATSGGGDGYAIMVLPKTDGTFFLGWRDVAGHRFICDNTFFQKNTTYRIEYRRTFEATGYHAAVRVYNAAGTLINDSEDPLLGGDDWTQLLPSNNPAIKMRDTLILFNDITDHTVERWGNNGPSSNFPGTSTYGTQATVVEGEGWYDFGAIAIGTAGWLGPYDPVLG